MTLIIGIRCEDGIVLGADSAATLAQMPTGQPTIIQPTKKLDIIAGCIIVGVSGPCGMSQLFKHEVETLWRNNKLSGKRSAEAMVILSKALRPHILAEWESAAVVAKTIGPSASLSAITSTVIAVPVSKLPCLFQFNHQGSPEEATKQLPFLSVGSGQLIADPFLAFLRHIFWEEKDPSVAEGILATVWTLNHAIRTSPGGVAEPLQIAVLDRESQDWKARVLQENELQEHFQAIKDAEDKLYAWKGELETPSKEIVLPIHTKGQNLSGPPNS